MSYLPSKKSSKSSRTEDIHLLAIPRRREGVRQLYNGLSKVVRDNSFEQDRIDVLEKLSLLPKHLMKLNSYPKSRKNWKITHLEKKKCTLSLEQKGRILPVSSLIPKSKTSIITSKFKVNRKDHRPVCSVTKSLAKSQILASPLWSLEERKHLNEIYWELGLPRRPGKSAMKDHLELYAKRHKVIYTNRLNKDIVARVHRMLSYNQFKEIGENNYWGEVASKRIRK